MCPKLIVPLQIDLAGTKGPGSDASLLPASGSQHAPRVSPQLTAS